MRVLSVGDRVPNGVFRLHSRFERVVNFTDGRGIVSVVTPEVGAGPVNVEVDIPSALGSSLAVVGRGAGGREIVLDGGRLDTTGVATYDSGIDLPRLPIRAFAVNLAVLGEFLCRCAPPRSLAFLLDPRRESEFRPGFERAVAAHLRDCARDAVHGDVARAARRIAGCGFGLTPSGDDFICGVLIAMRVGETAGGVSLLPLRRAIAAAARTGSLLTDAFLSLACEGRVSAKTQALIHALVAGSRDDIVRRGRDVVSTGETSGADFSVGLLLQLRTHMPCPVAGSAWAPGAPPCGDAVCH
jgi:hypothetical protein